MMGFRGVLGWRLVGLQFLGQQPTFAFGHRSSFIVKKGASFSRGRKENN
jgi:hypothetical protein